MALLSRFLKSNFPGFEINPPLFYNWPIGIRFEIGPDSIPIWLDRKNVKFNENYFIEAASRATAIFNEIFDDENEIAIIYKIFSDGRRKIRKNSTFFRLLGHPDTFRIEYSRQRSPQDTVDWGARSYHWKIATVITKYGQIKHADFINYAINSDFRIRTRRFQEPCVFINLSKGIIVDLYDDRGMDVIAKQTDVIQSLYHKFNDWILNYDRSKIDSIFGGA
jgi:hypothetical protein